MALHRKDALSELILFARKNSPFYGQTFASLPSGVTSIEELPITDADAYWSANSASTNQVMTGPFIDGCVMRSGGSTGTPKIIYMTKTEQKVVAQVMAVAMAQGCGFVAGDRIANLSHHGSLYGSFMLFNTAILEIPVPTVHLPISGNETISNMAGWIETFAATVLLSNVSTTRRLAEHICSLGKTIPSIRLILYTGERFPKQLRTIYLAAFPNATIYPSLYGSVDAGPIGIPAYPSRGGDDDINPVYKVLAPLLVVEILDDEGKPIKEIGVKGTLVITHLVKRQQPMLRYPTGDIGSWDDYHKETFRLHGRDSVSLKISTTHLPLSFLRETIAGVVGEDVVTGSQFVARRVPDSNQQVVIFRIVAPEPADPESIRELVESRITKSSPSWAKNRNVGNLAPLEIEWISADKLLVHEQTGKLRDIIEERF